MTVDAFTGSKAGSRPNHHNNFKETVKYDFGLHQ
jgi:hypothetical protein